jgi:hypothetical protein
VSIFFRIARFGFLAAASSDDRNSGGAWNGRDATFTDRGNSTFRAFSGGLVGGRAEGSHSWNVGLDSSFIGGGTLGCNYQAVGSPFVFGIEGEVGYMKLEGSAFDSLLNPTLPIPRCSRAGQDR